jgi:sulfatase modifying factor 1
VQSSICREAQPLLKTEGRNKSSRMIAASRPALSLAVAILALIGSTAAWRMVATLSSSAAPAVATSSPEPAPEGANFFPTVPNPPITSSDAPIGMVWIPGGEFSMGVQHSPDMNEVGMQATRDSQPIHRVYVDGFWIDKTDVTNEQFANFVKATGYVTIAERAPRAEDFPGAQPGNLVAGSVVFSSTDHAVSLTDHLEWWSYVKGANWRHPLGPQSNIQRKGKYPVVHIAYEDAVAYTEWAGKRLPTEAEWEFAARGGLSGKPFVWGDEFRPNGKWMANTYQGQFPVKNTNKGDDGFIGIAPVAQYPPNGYGLYDMAGNVWQWVSDWYRPDYYAQLAGAATVTRNPRGPASSFDPSEPTERKKVQRGGSFLCTDQYCSRYIVGTRGKGEVSTGTNHVGFRCVKDGEVSNRQKGRLSAAN